nr:ribosomal protein L23 [Trochiscia hystrix]
MMLNLIKYPVITEKSYISLLKNKQYTFDVDVRMTKTQMKSLFEDLFLVKIQSLNTHRPPRKRTRSLMGFKSRYKRVIITIKEDQVFNFNIKP